MAKAKSNAICCVVGCHKTRANCEGLVLHTFPGRRPWDQERRVAWIRAVNRKNLDGSDWQPTKNSFICNNHFQGGKPVNHPNSPAYIPTIFPKSYLKNKPNTKKNLARFDRAKRRTGTTRQHPSPQKTDENRSTNLSRAAALDHCYSTAPENIDAPPTPKKYVSTGTQTDLSIECDKVVETIILKQPEPEKESEATNSSLNNRNKGDDSNSIVVCKHGFHGKSSITDNQEMIDLAGVSTPVFEILLEMLPTNIKYRKISISDRLLIFLIKIKHGLTYSALGVLFSVHRTTVSTIFKEVLFIIRARTAREYIPWPSRDIINANMPPAFKEKYPKVRVIIDCFEAQVEQPHNIEHRNFIYSHYKSGFRDKFLVGITPDCIISFISKAYGGRSSDSGIVVDSGLCDLLEPHDEVMADKGFPGIVTICDTNHVVVIMPPFNHEGGLTAQEVDETYNIASIRIHVERVIERIKNHNILRFVTHDLQPMIDDIVHVICVLVNLQTPVIKF